MNPSDLEELLAAATPGPWHIRQIRGYSFDQVHGEDFCIADVDQGNGTPCLADVGVYDRNRTRRPGELAANARLIALAPELAAEVLRLRKAIGEIE